MSNGISSECSEISDLTLTGLVAGQGTLGLNVCTYTSTPWDGDSLSETFVVAGNPTPAFIG